MWLLYLVIGALVLYGGVVTAISLAQTRLLFPVQLAASGRPALPPSAKRIEVETPDGERLAGVRLGPDSGDGSVLLGFGGNAWNAEVMALYLHGLFPESVVVTFHYRGYSPSTGRPSAAFLLGDSLTVFDHLRRELPHPVVAIGFSIGSGVAAHLARHRPVAGLVLVTPFDSLEDLARDHFPWAPVRLVLRHRMSPLEDLREVSVPTALISAGRDTIVPPPRTEPLRRTAQNLVLDRVVAEAGHNDLYDRPDFIETIREALERVQQALPQR